METDRLSAALLAATYFHRVTAFRPLPGGGGEEGIVCEDRPCALSRSAQVRAPEPPDRSYVLPEAAYRLTLYTAPDLTFRLGDRAEVRDGSGQVIRGRTSDSFRYPSHCVTVLEAVEVGQDSREAEKGPPQNQQILWGEEERRNERAFAAGGSEGYEGRDDEGGEVL